MVIELQNYFCFFQIPSPPSMGASYDSRQSGSGGNKMGGGKKKSPSPGATGMDSSLSHSRSWRSTPDVPELAKAEDELR